MPEEPSRALEVVQQVKDLLPSLREEREFCSQEEEELTPASGPLISTHVL